SDRRSAAEVPQEQDHAGQDAQDEQRGEDHVEHPVVDAHATPAMVAAGARIREKECFEVRSVGCRSWFCPHCCLALGLALKRRLSRELTRFRGLMMLTFTVDPELFESPQAAYEYVTTKRCVAVAVQRLDRWDLLHSRDFFAVVEWQGNGWPHWHVLINASHVPFEQLGEAWNRNWRGWRARVDLG